MPRMLPAVIKYDSIGISAPRAIFREEVAPASREHEHLSHF